jgi:anti-sigma regulatory factor (Ser/Thr protein kinase)
MSQETIHLKFFSDPALLEGLRLKSESFARSLGFDEKTIGEIGLCVNEALANVIRHAYGGAHDRPIELTVEAAEDGMRIQMRDWGSGVDPSKLPVRPKDPMVPGGLGLICLREMMDRVEYAAQGGGGILLTLVKKLRK